MKSTKVRYKVGRYINPGTGQPAPAPLPFGAIAWNTSTDDPYITNISVSNPGTLNNGLEGDLLISQFTPAVETMDGSEYNNELYFMVVNLLRERDASATQAAQNVIITFNFGSSGINKLEKLNRQTGKAELMSLVSDGGSIYHLNLPLTGGTGDLFKYHTGMVFVIDPNQAPKIVHNAQAPGLNVPFEYSDAVETYGMKNGIASVTYSTFAGTIQTGGFARYATSLAGQNTTITSMPTNNDWAFKITYASKGNNFNDYAFVVKTKEGTPQELRVIGLTNNGSGGWSLIAYNTVVAANLPFSDSAFHTIVVHYKADSKTMDAYLDEKKIASNFTVAHGDYSIDYIQMNGYASMGTYCSFHGIKIGQVDLSWYDVCGDLMHKYMVGDINKDCNVNLFDLEILMDNWLVSTNPKVE